MSAGNLSSEPETWTGAVPVRDEGADPEAIDLARPYLEHAAEKAEVTITGYRVSRDPLTFGSRTIDPKAQGIVIVYADGKRYQ